LCPFISASDAGGRPHLDLWVVLLAPAVAAASVLSLLVVVFIDAWGGETA
jgi:hypothetical protein